MLRELLKRYLKIIFVNTLLYGVVAFGLYWSSLPKEGERIRCGMNQIIIFVPVIAFFCSLFTFTIFANVYSNVRNNKILRILSFFLLPTLIIFYYDIVSGLFFLIPFYLIIFYEYWQFSKRHNLK